jgi:hypothetical protein
MSWCSSRTPIGRDGAGKFIATASRYLSGCEVAAIRPKMSPKGRVRGPFVNSWRASNESKRIHVRYRFFDHDKIPGRTGALY